MPFCIYDDILKDGVAKDVQARFTREIQHLRALGFSEEFYIRETAFPLSALILSPILLLMIGSGERIRVRGLLQAVVYNPYLIHEQEHIYCAVLKIGVAYRSLFDDGTFLVTTTYDNGAKSQPQQRYIRQAAPAGDLNRAWTLHSKHVDQLEEEGRTVIAPLGMKDIVRLEMRNDTLMLGGVPADLKEKRKHDE